MTAERTLGWLGAEANWHREIFKNWNFRNAQIAVIAILVFAGFGNPMVQKRRKKLNLRLCLPLPPSSTVPDIRDLKIDDAADLDGAVLICMNKKSFLKCGNCNNRLKLILVTCVQFCLAKRCPICYKMDFQNTSHVVAFIAVAQGTL